MSPQDWLGRLIAYPTVSSDSNLELVCELRKAFEAIGGSCETFPDATGQKASLLARFGPDLPNGLLLSAHLDVVPVAGQSWSRPAFQMTREGSRLYGRGTTDMKGFVACLMALVETIDLSNLKRPLRIALSYDEEVGCVGVRPMLEHLTTRGLKPDLVVVGEPTSMRLGLGHKGKIGYRAACRGVARHSAEAPRALNALHLAADLMGELRALQDDLSETGAREDGYSVPHATVHAGVLRGGSAVNVVPSEAELVFETRFPASENSARIDARIRERADRISEAARARFADTGITLTETLAYPGLASDRSAPAIGDFALCLPEGTPPCWLNFGTEGGLFARALGVHVVVCGPGDMAQGHQPDEFIEEDQLGACAAMLEAAVARFCR